MVEVAKCTFEAARMACASARVIQSAAEGIGQSEERAGGFAALPDFDDFEVPLGESPLPAAAGTAGFEPDSDAPSDDAVSDEPESEPDAPASAALSPLPADVRDLIAECRSFFAQPEPR
jgi:hypothetical protein